MQPMHLILMQEMQAAWQIPVLIFQVQTPHFEIFNWFFFFFLLL